MRPLLRLTVILPSVGRRPIDRPSRQASTVDEVLQVTEACRLAAESSALLGTRLAWHGEYGG